MQSADSYSIDYNVTLDPMNLWVKYNVSTEKRETVIRKNKKNKSLSTTNLEKLKYLKNYPKGKKSDTYLG